LTNILCTNPGCIFGCGGAIGEGDGEPDDPESEEPSSCTVSTTVSFCAVECTVTDFGGTTTQTDCGSTTCAKTITACEATGTLRTEFSTTSITCPPPSPYVSWWTDTDELLPTFVFNPGAANVGTWTFPTGPLSVSGVGGGTPPPSSTPPLTTPVTPPVVTTPVVTPPVVTPPVVTPPVVTLPFLTFCVFQQLDIKTETEGFLYYWFADDGTTTCLSLSNSDSLGLGSANLAQDEEGGISNFPFPTVRMGDLNPTYPNFFDCEFITGFTATDPATTYNGFPTESEVGVIGCNDMPSTVTTVDGFYGTCFKLHDSNTNSAGVTIQTLFFCTMEDPR